MKAKISTGKRYSKKFSASLFNYVGVFDVRAVEEYDFFVLAALYRALFGKENEACELRDAIKDEADRCKADHEMWNKPKTETN
jgi:hypothetical protein